MGIPEISSHDGTTKIRSIKPWRHFKQLKKTLLKTNLLFLRVFSESIIVYVHDIHVCVIHQFMEYYILFVVGILTEKLGYFCEQSFLISGNSYVIKHYIVLKSRSWNMVIRLRMNLFVSENKKNYLILRRLYEERLWQEIVCKNTCSKKVSSLHEPTQKVKHSETYTWLKWNCSILIA